MSKNNFDANEILRQSGRVKEEAVNFNKDSSNMISVLQSAAIVLKTEDGDLALKCRQFANSYISFQVEIGRKFNKLAEIMESYAQQTLKNQEHLSQEISELDDSIQDINNTLSSISNSIPEIYVDFD